MYVIFRINVCHFSQNGQKKWAIAQKMTYKK